MAYWKELFYKKKRAIEFYAGLQANIKFRVKEITGEYPVLLLDDVLSELDFNRKRYVLTSIKNIQTVITCTGIEDLTSYLDENSKVFRVINGRIQC